ncbi:MULTISPECIES: acyl-CoA dehydrogenase family protein [Burkholderia]|uniref:acyl-CoA dehydrogenase family protein n=1 Tax=Burkholderia TaxID=32008 RepID=UPI001589E53A|nr:acyl-CoA dehydrogenase family protein [Burkholderia seminalis]
MSDAMNPSDLHALSDAEFRLRLRDWLTEHYPPNWRQDTLRPFRRLRGAEAVQWLRLLHEHGWRAPAWQREHGGMGLSFARQRIYHEEFERACVARVVDLGETQLGPTLAQLGTAEQKAYYLPRILSCEHVWCQGYSEPNAGSDLASLKTRATLDASAEHFVVNGQKIWTTQANEATHIFALVRTGNLGKKQLGISFLLIDLKTPGITIRPIVNLAGEDEFCEVFFDDVRVPVANLVGELHQGWTVAKTLLGHERIWIGSPALAGRALGLTAHLLRETGAHADAGLMDRYAQLAADLHDYRLLYAEMCDAVEDGHAPGPDASVLKIFVSELLQRITAFNAELGSEHAGLVGRSQVGSTAVDLHWQAMMALPPTIFAGANEIQRNILAKSVLGLAAEGSA